MNHLHLQRFKDNFMRFNLHRLVEPFSAVLTKIITFSKLSHWRNHTPFSAHNDFYSAGFNSENRYKLYKFLCDKYQLSNKALNHIEFGVEEGNCLKWWLANNTNPASQFLVLDTFEGLPEECEHFSKGDRAYPIENLQHNDSRLKLFKGLFQQIANPALQQLNPLLGTIYHIGAGLFSSALVALTQSYRFMKPGDLVIFDQFSPAHAFWAFHTFIRSCYVQYELVAAASNYTFVAIEIK